MLHCNGRRCPPHYICTEKANCLPCSSICVRDGKPNPGAICENECPGFFEHYYKSAEDTSPLGTHSDHSDHIAEKDTTEFLEKHFNASDGAGMRYDQRFDKNTVDMDIILLSVCVILFFVCIAMFLKLYLLPKRRRSSGSCQTKAKLAAQSVHSEDLGEDGQCKIEIDSETERWSRKCGSWVCTNTEPLYEEVVDRGNTGTQTSLCNASTNSKECQTDLDYSIPIPTRASSSYSLNTLKTEYMSFKDGPMPRANKRSHEETYVPRESKQQSHNSVYPFEQAPDNTGDQYDSQASRYPFTDANSAPSQYRPTVPSLQKPGVPIPNKQRCIIAVQTDVTISVEHGTSSTNAEAVQDTGSVKSQCPATAPSLTKLKVCDSAQLALIGSSAAPNDKL